MCKLAMVRQALCLIVCLLALGSLPPLTSAAQEDPARYRIIAPDPQMRPSKKSARMSSARRRARPGRGYQALNDSSFGKKSPMGMVYGKLGVTVLRRRLASVKDDNDTAREKRNNMDFVWERINDDTLLAPGDEVRVSVESPAAGYLYVVGREQYSDGTLGRALLIFPTLSTYHGDNRIEPRIPRILPESDGEFEIHPNNQGKVQVAERLTIIVSPKPLDTPRPLTHLEMELPAGWVEKWERDWSGRTDRATWLGKMGQTQTQRELAAGRLKARELRQKKSLALNDDDPSSQNYYQVTIRRGMPTLVVIPLQFKAQ